MNNADNYNSISKPKRSDTSRISQEFIEKYFNETNKIIIINDLSIMKDDIKNYKSLTPMQLIQLDKLSEQEKIDIIHLYNTMFSTLEDTIVK
jgi:hypothetical protein|uniref:Uncharacterized protein n=1 Tax=viral metagenome TaxID=1070528 RepID=A0A6C0D8A0_9ZZZZ